MATSNKYVDELESFYVFLPSDGDSLGHYRENRNTFYTIGLANALKLDSRKWRVGMSEIIIPQLIYNVVPPMNKFKVMNRFGRAYLTLASGVYTPVSFSNACNEAIASCEQLKPWASPGLLEDESASEYDFDFENTLGRKPTHQTEEEEEQQQQPPAPARDPKKSAPRVRPRATPAPPPRPPRRALATPEEEEEEPASSDNKKRKTEEMQQCVLCGEVLPSGENSNEQVVEHVRAHHRQFYNVFRHLLERYGMAGPPPEVSAQISERYPMYSRDMHLTHPDIVIQLPPYDETRGLAGFVEESRREREEIESAFQHPASTPAGMAERAEYYRRKREEQEAEERARAAENGERRSMMDEITERQQRELDEQLDDGTVDPSLLRHHRPLPPSDNPNRRPIRGDGEGLLDFVARRRREREEADRRFERMRREMLGEEEELVVPEGEEGTMAAEFRRRRHRLLHGGEDEPPPPPPAQAPPEAPAPPASNNNEGSPTRGLSALLEAKRREREEMERTGVEDGAQPHEAPRDPAPAPAPSRRSGLSAWLEERRRERAEKESQFEHPRSSAAGWAERAAHARRERERREEMERETTGDDESEFAKEMDRRYGGPRTHSRAQSKVFAGKMYFDEASKKFYFDLDAQGEIIRFFDRNLIEMMGFSKASQGIVKGRDKRVPYFLGEKHLGLIPLEFPAEFDMFSRLLYVYSNIVRRSAIGSQDAPLLRIVSVNNSNKSIQSSVIHNIYDRPQYHRLDGDNISEINIQIRDFMGSEIPLQTGKVVVVLQFKKIK